MMGERPDETAALLKAAVFRVSRRFLLLSELPETDLHVIRRAPSPMTTSKSMIDAMTGHSPWANDKLLTAAEALSPSELTTPIPGADGSIRDVLVHMMNAQLGWTRRFQELDPVAPFDSATITTIPELRKIWTTVDRDTADVIASISDDDLETIIHFKSWFGWEGTSPRWQAILHQAYHQHQHRGEVAMALTALGHSPGELDMFDYLDMLGNR